MPKYWDAFFGELLDGMPADRQVIDRLKVMLLSQSTPWFKVLDIIELAIGNVPLEIANQLREFTNEVLVRENAAYRIVADFVTPIVDSTEVDAIEGALNAANSFAGVSRHLRRALELLSDRDHPDYRNSIKESISAVEAICKARMPGTKKNATLGEALTSLERAKVLHPVLKSSFSSLYGYTSSANGIRHALMDEPTVSFAEAKLLLVTCSAFVHYLSATLSSEKNLATNDGMAPGT